MSVSSTGALDSTVQDFLSRLINNNGINIVLIGNNASVSYTDTDLLSYTTASATVGTSGLTTTSASGFSGIATLELSTQVDFGTVSIGQVNDVVIQNVDTPTRMVLANEINNPNTTGEQVTLSSGTSLYSFGNP